MVLSIAGNKTKIINEIDAKLIDEAITKGVAINVQGELLQPDIILGIFTNEKWAELQEEAGTGYLRQEPVKKPNEKNTDLWLRLIRTNFKLQKSTGKYGTMRTLDDLKKYDETGELPAYVKPAPATEMTDVTDGYQGKEHHGIVGQYPTFNADGTYHQADYLTYQNLVKPGSP